jgi:glycerol kinase
MDEGERAERLKGWQSAVERSTGWAS